MSYVLNKFVQYLKWIKQAGIHMIFSRNITVYVSIKRSNKELSMLK